MARYTKSGTVNRIQEVNAELEKIATAQDEFLTRNGETPNEMKSGIDMNGNRIINLPSPANLSEPLRLSDLNSLSGTTINLNSEIKVYTSVAELAAQTDLEIGQAVKTKGYYSANDGGGADYLIVSTGTGTDDGGSYLDLGNGNQAQLNVSNSINIKQFGAKGDGLTDDSPSVLTAIEFANGVTVFFPKGQYLINVITVNVEKLKLDAESPRHSLILGGIIQSFPSATTLTDVRNIAFIAQNSTTASCLDINAGTTTTASNILITNCYFANARRQLNVNCGAKNVQIHNNVFDNCGSALADAATSIQVGNSSSSAQASSDIYITNNNITNVECAGSGEAHGLIITGNNVHINNNNVENVINGTDGNGAEAIYTKATNFTVTNNTILDGGNGQGAICLKGNARESGIYPEGYDGVVEGNVIVFSGVQTNNIGVYTFIENILIKNNIISGASASQFGDVTFGNSSLKCTVEGNKITDSTSTYIMALDSCGSGHVIKNNIVDNFDISVASSTEAVININIPATTVMTDVVISGNRITISEPSTTVSSLIFVSVNAGDAEGMSNFYLTDNNVQYPLTNVTRYYFLRYSASVGTAEPLVKTFITGNTTNDASLPNYIRGFGKNSLATFTGTSCRESFNSWQFAAIPNADTNYYSIAGTVIYDVTPTAGGTIGWVCTAEGSAGTFKTFGAITA